MMRLCFRTRPRYWNYAHYFEIASEQDDKNITVKCTVCVGERLLSTAENSTSNLKKKKKNLTSKQHSITLSARPAEEEDDGAPATKQHLSFSSAKSVSASENCVVEETLPQSPSS